ncbi:MAG: hypothetical protein ACYCXG_03410 [Acidiferrobacter sp.]
MITDTGSATPSPDRRHFLRSCLTTTGGVVALGLVPGAWADETSRALDFTAHPPAPAWVVGAVTLYTEFRVMPQHNAQSLAAIAALAHQLRTKPGFLSLVLKQMSGDSTMVKNYPESYKGVLATAYLDGVAAHTQPYFYALFIRFDDGATAHASGAAQAFDAHVLPYLYPLMPTAHGARSGPTPMAVYRGLFVTIAAGDRHGIYTSDVAIRKFLRHPLERPERDTITVENHVMIADAGHQRWEQQVGALLKVAQDSYQPVDAANGVGLPGARDNRDYRKALTTEILRNAAADGELRAYIMHGVWESVWDHENSHLDPRFLAAAAPVGAGIEIGPVEPFYLTRALVTS